MFKLKQKFALILALILALGTMVPVHAEEMAEKIRQLTGQESAPAAENAGQEEVQQTASDDEVILTNDESASSRAAFTPDLMIAPAGTKVYADSQMTAVLGVIKNGSVVYAVSLSGNAVRIALVSGREVIEGYVPFDVLNALSKSSKSTYMMAASRGVRVYDQKLVSISFTKASGSVTAAPQTTATPKPTETPRETAAPKVTATPTAKATLSPATEVPSNYPIIEEQTASASGVNGRFTLLYVKAKNANAYQWQASQDQGATWADLSNNAVWIGNQKASMYFIPSARYETYLFRCKVTNRSGSVYSSPVSLSGKEPSAPTAAPTEAPTVEPTATPTVTPAATPTAEPTARPTLQPTVTPTVQPTVTSTVTPAVTPTAAPTAGQLMISVQPKDASAAEGQKVSFTVKAENADAYQWYYFDPSANVWTLLSDGSVWSGTQSPVLSFTASAAYHGGRFRCLVSGLNASMNSKEAGFAFVSGAPVFDTSVDTLVKGIMGSEVTLVAKVSGATSCQWQINPNRGVWGNISGADYGDLTSPSLTVRLSQNNLSYSYRLKATNAHGTTYSPVYTLGEMIPGPTNVRAESSGKNSISVSWTASASAKAKRYLVYYNSVNTIDFSQYVTAPGNNAQLTDLAAGTTYHVWVQAEGNNVSSVVDDSVHASATTYAPAAKPNPPANVAAVPQSSSFTVSWQKPSDSEIDGYFVYYRLPASNEIKKLQVNGEDTLSAVLSGLTKDTAYELWVTAFNVLGESEACASVTAATLATAASPSQPRDVKAFSASPTSVQVSWSLSDSTNVAGYYVYYGTSVNVNLAVRSGTVYSSKTSRATISGLTSGTMYYFWVTAFNSDGVQSALNSNVQDAAIPKKVSSEVKINAVAFSMKGDAYLGTSYYQHDCQAFVEKMLADAGLYHNLAGSNAWFRTMTWRGTPEECVATFGCVPTGAFLYVLKFDGGEPSYYRDNYGNASHIGVVTHRNDGAIHSSYSRGCVCTSVFNDATVPDLWNMVGLWYRMDYGEPINSMLEAMREK